MDVANIENLRKLTRRVFSFDLKVTLLGNKKVLWWAGQNEKSLSGRSYWFPLFWYCCTLLSVTIRKHNLLQLCNGVFLLTDLTRLMVSGKLNKIWNISERSYLLLLCIHLILLTLLNLKKNMTYCNGAFRWLESLSSATKMVYLMI